MRHEVISKMQEIVGKDYVISGEENIQPYVFDCLLYTSDAADEL